MPNNTLKVRFTATTAVDSLGETVRQRLVETVQRLETTAPEDWPEDEVTRLPVPEPLYLLRLPPDYRIILGRTEGGELEVQEIFREEGLRIWRQMEEQRNGGPRG